MTPEIKRLLDAYVETVKRIYGPHLRKVILYGSYARGDFHEDSDIDVMLLLDLPFMDVENDWQQLSHATYDFNEEHDSDVSATAKSEEHFRYWEHALPFYKNVKKDGVLLYEAA